MKRNVVVLLLHPYKNALVPVARLKAAVDRFAESLLKLTNDFPGLRWNLLLAGYLLERMDSILLSKIREVQKRDALEWLCCGYTEPFLGFSPLSLSEENVRTGADLLTSLTGAPPAGYAPPFSNWEPSFVPVLDGLGFRYAILSEALFPASLRSIRSFWATEHLGATVNLFPVHSMHPYAAPQHVEAWLETSLAGGTGTGVKLLCIDYLIPLAEADQPDPFDWLRRAAQAIEKNAIVYQSVRFDECLAMSPPAGLHYPQPSLLISRSDERPAREFLDYLHTYDQIGIMQRRMMEIDEALSSRGSSRHISELRKRLFFVQDINRFLPARTHGFLNAADRAWTFDRLIGLDTQLHHDEKTSGGQIRIADFLKNGSKCAVMANGPLKVYIDHRNGGHVFELDFRSRNINVCAVASPERHEIPRITMPGKTRTAFTDHLIGEDTLMETFAAGHALELGDFCGAPFDYTVKKTASSVRCVLVRTGSVSQGDKSFPLTMEKVFGLVGDAAILSFVYKFSSHSLVSHSFRFAVSLPLFLPGAPLGEAHVSHGRVGLSDLLAGRTALEGLTRLIVGDHARGMHLVLVTQKPVDVWCYPLGPADDYQGTALVISSRVTIEGTAPWSLIGRLEFKRTGVKVKLPDAC